jgi:hypothetical protein
MGKKKPKQNEGMKPGAEAILHRDLSTNTQLGMLLSVCNTMFAALLHPEREAENIPGKHLFPGEAKIAAENTFTKACARIDSILDEAKRWGIDYQLTLEQQYLDRHKEQLSLMKAQQDFAHQQRKTAEQIVRPNFRYKPVLLNTEDGKWVAFLGNIDDIESGIMGAGDNPQQALDSFDEAFAGKLSPAILEWLRVREAKLEQGDASMASFPTKEQQNEQIELDGEGDRDTDPPAEKRDDDAGDSARDGAQ